MREMLDRIQRDHIPAGEPILTTVDLMESDEMAAFMPPIALWPLPLVQRVALLAGDVFLGRIFQRNVWRDALRVQDLTLEEEDGGWVITGGAEPLRFDALEVAKMRLGIAFAAVVLAAEANRSTRDNPRAPEQPAWRATLA